MHTCVHGLDRIRRMFIEEIAQDDRIDPAVDQLVKCFAHFYVFTQDRLCVMQFLRIAVADCGDFSATLNIDRFNLLQTSECTKNADLDVFHSMILPFFYCDCLICSRRSGSFSLLPHIRGQKLQIL